MWTRTRVTEKLNIKLPIVQGPFGGGPSSIDLAAAVSNAGGLGSFGAYSYTPEQIKELVANLRERTPYAFAINLWIPFTPAHETKITRTEYDDSVARLAPYYAEVGMKAPTYESLFRAPDFDAQVAALLDAGPPAFSFVFGIPSAEILRACRERKIVTIGAATNIDEVIALEAAGVDLIVATGSEAGGHRVSFLHDPDVSPANSALIPQAADRVRTPLIAAGGIADGRGIVAALAFGASAVQIGTAFLACEESNATPTHKAAIRSEQSRHTTLTRAFSGRYARGIKNRFLLEMREHESKLPAFPYQNFLTQPMRQGAARMDEPALQSLWAGQNAPLVKYKRADELIKFLVEDTNRVLGRLRSLEESTAR